MNKKNIGKNMAIFVIAAVMLTVLSGCIGGEEGTSTTTPAPTTPAKTLPVYSGETETYTNLEYGFSLKYPADWELMENFMGLTVILGGPQVMEGSFMVNISVVREEIPENLAKKMTLEDYVKASELNAKKTFTEYNKVDEYNTTLAGVPATVITCNIVLEIEGITYSLKDSFAIFIKDGVGYTISYDVPAEFHDDYIDCFGLIVNSFTFD